MVDSKTSLAQRFEAARAAWTQGDETAAAESFRSAIVVARSDPSFRRELASALFNLGKLSLKLGPAGEVEAETLLAEALTISEELFGREHPALAPLLQALSRLYLKESQDALAEDAVERLLAIARAKGDEHPDVATALADLAFVKRKRGDAAAAEALYRDALRIREKVLEPNHAATLGTLDRLSETCAARGNFVEALALLQRVLPTREAALGAGHKRVRAARSRVAEYELQIALVADAAAVAAARAATHTPPWLAQVANSPADAPSSIMPSPDTSKAVEFLGEPEPRAVRPFPRPRERSKAPAVAAAVAVASLMASTATPAVSQVVIPPTERARPSQGSTDRESSAPHRNLVLADVVSADMSHADVASGEAEVGDWRAAAASVPDDLPEPAPKKRTRIYASAGAGAVAIALAGLLMAHPRAVSGKRSVLTAMSAAQPRTESGASAGVVTVSATKTGSTAAGAAAAVASTHADSIRTATAAHAPSTAAAATTQRDQHAPNTGAPALVAPQIDVHVDSINGASMPAMPTVDAILRSTTERQRTPDTVRLEIKPISSPTPAVEVETAHTSPRIIGHAPDPGFPDALIRTGLREGQVVVRFIVNEQGRVDVGSLVVERADDELFTKAVREVLPLFRFEPARTISPEPKPVAVWVSLPFRFTTRKK